MPGPISDSYDPEFGTRAREFRDEYERIHKIISNIINAPPIYYKDLPSLSAGPSISAKLPERDWRFIRYALERTIDSI